MLNNGTGVTVFTLVPLNEGVKGARTWLCQSVAPRKHAIRDPKLLAPRADDVKSIFGEKSRLAM